MTEGLLSDNVPMFQYNNALINLMVNILLDCYFHNHPKLLRTCKVIVFDITILVIFHYFVNLSYVKGRKGRKVALGLQSFLVLDLLMTLFLLQKLNNVDWGNCSFDAIPSDNKQKNHPCLTTFFLLYSKIYHLLHCLASSVNQFRENASISAWTYM